MKNKSYKIKIGEQFDFINFDMYPCTSSDPLTKEWAEYDDEGDIVKFRTLTSTLIREMYELQDK